jgi:hypothetical protein
LPPTGGAGSCAGSSGKNYCGLDECHVILPSLVQLSVLTAVANRKGPGIESASKVIACV